MHTHLRIHTYMHTCTHTHNYIYTYIHTPIRKCTRVRCIAFMQYIFAVIYVCVCLFIYIYTPISTDLRKVQSFVETCMRTRLATSDVPIGPAPITSLHKVLSQTCLTKHMRRLLTHACVSHACVPTPSHPTIYTPHVFTGYHHRVCHT